MLTDRGQIKMLDFGLAKMAARSEAESDAPTEAKTSAGMVMGTVQYMSPEQAMGRDVDGRSDIFSLGVVLYELATGRLPFSGANATETLARITTSQPEAIARLNYDVPAELERVIRKCLEKDPDARYQSARDLLVDLKNLKRDTESGAVTATTPSRGNRWPALAVGAFVLIATWKPGWLLIGTHPERADTHRRFFVLGAVVGVLNMTIGAAGPLIAPFFLRIGLPRQALVGTKAACQAAGHLVKIAVFGIAGFVFADYAVPLALLSLSVIAGTWIGSQLLDRVSERWFKRLYRGVLTLIALRLVIWEGMAWLGVR